MPRTRTIAALTLAVLGSTMLAPASARAEVPPTLTVAPQEALNNADVTVSGTGCGTDDHGAVEISFLHPSWSPTPVVVGTVGVTSDDGAWSDTVAVPDINEIYLGQVTISASCDLEGGTFDYEPVPFTILGPSMHVDPARGPVGTEVTLSGTGCASTVTGPGRVRVGSLLGTGDMGELAGSLNATPSEPKVAADGSWTAKGTIPGFLGYDGKPTIATPPGSFRLIGDCVIPLEEGGRIEGGIGTSFEVTPSPAGPTVTPPPPATPIEEPPHPTG